MKKPQRKLYLAAALIVAVTISLAGGAPASSQPVLSGLVSSNWYHVAASSTGQQFFVYPTGQSVPLPGAGVIGDRVQVFTGPMGNQWYIDKNGARVNLPPPSAYPTQPAQAQSAPQSSQQSATTSGSSGSGSGGSGSTTFAPTFSVGAPYPAPYSTYPYPQTYPAYPAAPPVQVYGTANVYSTPATGTTTSGTTSSGTTTSGTAPTASSGSLTTSGSGTVSTPAGQSSYQHSGQAGTSPSATARYSQTPARASASSEHSEPGPIGQRGLNSRPTGGSQQGGIFSQVHQTRSGSNESGDGLRQRKGSGPGGSRSRHGESGSGAVAGGGHGSSPGGAAGHQRGGQLAGQRGGQRGGSFGGSHALAPQHGKSGFSGISRGGSRGGRGGRR